MALAVGICEPGNICGCHITALESTYDMKGELLHAENPWQSRLRWLGVYAVLTLAVLGGSYAMVSRIRTYSLPTGGVQLSVPYSTYITGETVSFTVKNNFNSAIYINNGCPSEPLSVYRFENNAWVRIHATTALTNCASQERTVKVPANSAMTATFANWPTLFASPGKYRLVMQVQYYNALPYQDFEVITPPAPFVASKSSSAVATATPGSSSATSSGGSTKTGSTNNNTTSTTTATPSGTNPTPTPTPAPAPASNPQTYTLYVNSAGNYATTTFNLNVGDSIKIIYQKPYSNEVRTHFTPINGTTTAVSSLTVDSEFTSGTRLFSSAGSWSFKADDHNGNSGTIVVK
jgi:hypothetical protein